MRGPAGVFITPVLFPPAPGSPGSSARFDTDCAMIQHDPNASDRLVRINRFLAQCGIASRRRAEELVLGGRVEINRKTIRDLATRVDPSCDSVSVDGRPVTLSRGYVYLVMNKPKDTITTVSDERGRRTVMSLVHAKQRIYPIGRLDRHTTGVLLLTNDGEFAHRLMHPKFEIEKSYRVTCDRVVSREHLEQLRAGVHVGGSATARARVYQLAGGRGKEIGIVIHEGRNRQVRKMFEQLGYQVEKLDRVAYGPVTKVGLGRGETRSLTRPEIRQLKKLAGLDEDAHDRA